MVFFFLLASEVTKVRRNLFNQEGESPSRKNRLPRSRSVSAVEGLKRKRRDSESEGKATKGNENCADYYLSPK